MNAGMIMSVFGTGIVFLCNYFFFKFSILDICKTIGFANVWFFVCLFSTLKLEKIQLVNKICMGSIFKTWIFFLTQFSCLMLMTCPVTRSIKSYLLTFPVLLTTGPAILAFGVIKDFWLRRSVQQQWVSKEA
jgi:hypothetical protein